MSVINKMLRDLDQRHVAHTAGATTGAPPFSNGVQLGRYRAPVEGVSVPTARRHRPLVLVAAVCIGLGALAWYVVQKGPPGGVVVVESAPVKTLPVPAAVQTDAPAQQPSVQSASAPDISSTATLVAAPVKQAPNTPTAAQAVEPQPLTAKRIEPEARSASAASLRMDTALASSNPPIGDVDAKVPAAAKPVSPKTDATLGLQRQQLASEDALSQAQTLWGSGSHAAAIDLVQQAVDAAERAVEAGSSPPANPVLLSLVRELTRMQMAQGRHGAVWDLLSRLEPILGNAPDLWGLRGNTAQRLGRHTDSVHAYTVALQSRPNEQRWMLGAAVSLAALGQTDQAGSMAEKAQGVGDISREVQAYLHQMGVPLKNGADSTLRN